ncbi:Elongation factor P [secondary endosymbiont of Trabutina mannipara]|uniref:Elongation factor P n=1 Tax=secondary endosymbiont of Trabutina mannipara TaxID=1835721 RepID=A0A1C3L480_9ENTR|nr:elongation factor P [secondary endosymbiont of Trabutina mannipara]SBT82074.1 Elongation factor P [secondary endosymbiont of Trabutina mannipara]
MVYYYSTKEFSCGIKIMFDGEPCSIIDNQFVNPGKGQAFNRVRMKKLISGKILEKVFKSGRLVEAADVIDINFIYLYNDGKFCYFMNNSNFEQLAVNIKLVGDTIKWMVEQTEYVITLWNGQVIAVTTPNFVALKIIKTDPYGYNISTSGKKIAILTTGAIVKVPLFVNVGEIIKVDTRSSEYVSREK